MRIHADHRLSWSPPVPPAKSSALSAAARERGAAHARAGRQEAALEELNTAARLATTAEELGWVAAARSSATLELGLVQECLEDCRLALASLPPSLALQRLRVWQRSAVCWALLGEEGAVARVVAVARGELAAAGVAEEARGRLVAGLETAVEEAKGRGEVGGSGAEVPHLTTPGTNPMVSRKVKVEVAEGAAMRHVVATEAIKAGEVIVEEMPISAVLHPSHLTSHCSTCLRPAVAGVPCSSCSSVIFCSPGCREQAAATFHGPECRAPPPALGPLAPALRCRGTVVVWCQLSHLLHPTIILN